MKTLNLMIILALAACTAHGQTVAITNAEVHTISGAVIEGGTVVIEDGRIAAVGVQVAVPAGARIIDGTGKVVTPGFIDSASQVGLSEIPGASGTADASTSEKDFGATFNPVWAVNPENTRIPITRLRGVTASVVGPGGSQLFTGQGSVLALDGETVGDMLREEFVAVYTAMGEAGSSRAGGSRAANYRKLHDAFWDARAKALSGSGEDEDEDDEEEKSAEETGGRSGLKDRELDVLGTVLDGDVALVVQVNRVSDLRLALRLREEFGFRLVIQGGAEAWRIADELAAADVAVVVSVTANLPRFDGLAATLENAGRLQHAGVQVLLSGGRGLAHEAGLAVANGMDHAAALRAVTLGAAETWGVSDTMGSIDQGKIADIVVWSGDPFELSTSAEHIFIGGREIPEDSRQERLFDRYRDLGRYRTIGN